MPSASRAALQGFDHPDWEESRATLARGLRLAFSDAWGECCEGVGWLADPMVELTHPRPALGDIFEGVLAADLGEPDFA